MDPVATSQNGDISKDDTVSILVTGFGPFMQQFPVNPSFFVAQHLPDAVPSCDSHKTIRVVKYDKPIRVAFEDVRKLVPQLYHEYHGKFDCVLHIGMAAGRDFYTLERLGHRDGYGKHEDVDGKAPSADEGRTQFPDCPDYLVTSLKYDEILSSWKDNVSNLPEGSAGHGADVRPSNDAGYYLCDYIYFQSLAYCARKSNAYQGGIDKDRPVLFFHVPAESDEKTLAKSLAVCVSLIQAIGSAYTKPSHKDAS